jgi:hypothetical protein
MVDNKNKKRVKDVYSADFFYSVFVQLQRLTRCEKDDSPLKAKSAF